MLQDPFHEGASGHISDEHIRISPVREVHNFVPSICREVHSPEVCLEFLNNVKFSNKLQQSLLTLIAKFGRIPVSAQGMLEHQTPE